MRAESKADQHEIVVVKIEIARFSPAEAVPGAAHRFFTGNHCIFTRFAPFAAWISKVEGGSLPFILTAV